MFASTRLPTSGVHFSLLVDGKSRTRAHAYNLPSLGVFSGAYTYIQYAMLPIESVNLHAEIQAYIYSACKDFI